MNTPAIYDFLGVSNALLCFESMTEHHPKAVITLKQKPGKTPLYRVTVKPVTVPND
jgi:hypothetical protein